MTLSHKKPGSSGQALVVTIGGRAVPALAQLLDGEDAEIVSQQMMAVAPMYRSYRAKTDRSIRVFVLTAP